MVRRADLGHHYNTTFSRSTTINAIAMPHLLNQPEELGSVDLPIAVLIKGPNQIQHLQGRKFSIVNW